MTDAHFGVLPDTDKQTWGTRADRDHARRLERALKVAEEALSHVEVYPNIRTDIGTMIHDEVRAALAQIKELRND